MARLRDGHFDTREPVRATDEIGAVAEGFNRMLHGLRERELVKETFGKYVTPEIRDEIRAIEDRWQVPTYSKFPIAVGQYRQERITPQRQQDRRGHREHEVLDDVEAEVFRIDQRRQPQRQLERRPRPQHVAGGRRRRQSIRAGHLEHRAPGAVEHEFGQVRIHRHHAGQERELVVHRGADDFGGHSHAEYTAVQR